jgi:hypothetical protein
MLQLKEEINNIWNQIVVVEKELAQYSNSSFSMPETNPSATPEELDELERHLRLKLPPSYRAFLTLYNGVRNFEYDMPLLSTHEIIAGGDAWVEDVEEEFPELARFFIAGSDYTYAGSYFFNYQCTSDDGEMEIVHISIKMEDARWSSFKEMLIDRLERLMLLLKAERADREKLED